MHIKWVQLFILNINIYIFKIYLILLIGQVLISWLSNIHQLFKTVRVCTKLTHLASNYFSKYIFLYHGIDITPFIAIIICQTFIKFLHKNRILFLLK